MRRAQDDGLSKFIGEGGSTKGGGVEIRRRPVVSRGKNFGGEKGK